VISVACHLPDSPPKELFLSASGPFVIVAKVDPSVPQDARREQSDGREDKYIFVRHVEETEGIVIMGPSEHN
jgi:hypothetical protein